MREERIRDCWSLEVFHCAAEYEATAPLKARDYKDPLVIAYEQNELGWHTDSTNIDTEQCKRSAEDA